MGRQEEDIVMRQEHELWEAARRQDCAAFYKYFAPEVNVICNKFSCSGEEYVMTLPAFGMQRYSIERYETVTQGEEVIQNYYLVNLKIVDSIEVKTCHVTSTWRKILGEWKIVFHMRTLIN